MAFFKNRIRNLLNDFLDEEKYDVTDSGKIVPKDAASDVGDTTIKFAGTKFATPFSGGSKKRNVEFLRPEYDLPTIANAIQLDGILNRSVCLFVEQILKNSFEMVSKNEQVQTHVQRRIKEIEHFTNISFFETINKIARQLVTYGNCYVVKVRGNKSRFGKKYNLYGKETNPIIGLFIAEATTVELGLNNKGQIVEYKQNIRGNTRQWDARDVIHLAYNHIPGTLTGRSNITPILDDVRALRKLEEEVEILGFQYSIPLYVYKVGNKDHPPAPGEIAEAAANVNSMPAYGMLVVPGHHSIEVPSNTSTPVEIMEFIAHFKNRIFAGLGISPVAMGEVSSSNRNTSEVLDMSMQTITKSYQRIIQNKSEMELFKEILLDGGFDIISDKLDFSFPEIDQEAQIKKETNIIQKWQNNLATREESRLEMDYEKTINEADTYLHLVEIPKIEAEGAVQEAVGIAIQKAKPKTTTSSSTKAKKTTSNKVAPANQHGKSSGRPKFVRNFLSDILHWNDALSIDLADETLSESAFNKNTYISSLISKLEDRVKRQLKYNIDVYKSYYHIDLDEINSSFIDNFIKTSKFIISDKINTLSRFSKDPFKMQVRKQDINVFLNEQTDKVDNLAKILIYESLGFRTILIDASNCDIHGSGKLSLESINYFNMPPVSYGCKCHVKEDNFNCL